MPVAFVHGNPETSAIWQPLVFEIGSHGFEVDDIELLSPPGFGAPVPEGFGATQVEYRDWLVAELERMGGNVDLVGHDWGAGHVLGVLASRPDLVRTWATDCLGLIHPEYEWHDAAQAWQTDGVGEELIASMSEGSTEDRVNGYMSLGIPSDVAGEMVNAFDDVMGRCILSLYRSAKQPAMHELGWDMSKVELPPGLAVIATADEFAGSPTMAERVASEFDARILRLEGEGHWWMFGGAGQAAQALIELWGSV